MKDVIDEKSVILQDERPIFVDEDGAASAVGRLQLLENKLLVVRMSDKDRFQDKYAPIVSGKGHPPSRDFQ